MRAKKNPKKEIGRNSSIYFAIGLNIMLLSAWQALEYRTFEIEVDDIEIMEISPEFDEEIPITNYTKPPLPPPITVSETIKVVEDVVEIEETVIESTESSQEDEIGPAEEVVAVEDVKVEEVEEYAEVPFAVIEEVPVFPGCEGLSKADAKACFQTKMMAHVKEHFKYPQEALELGVQGRVSVMFFIDETGCVTGIRSRGPDRNLEKEAERIIASLPVMKPGLQRGKPVKVSYAMPIFFKYSG